MSLARRVRLGALASLGSQVVVTAAQVLLVPLFLAAWGGELYGEWLTLAAAVGYAAVADLGLSTYVVNRLTTARVRGDQREYLEVLHSALAFTLTVGVLVLAGVCALAWCLPFERWFGFVQTGASGARWTVALIALQVASAIPRGLVLGLYRTIEEYPRGVLIANGQRLGAFAATALALVAGGGPASVAAAQLLPLFAALLWVLVDLRRRHAPIRLGVRHRVRGLALSFLRPSLHFFAVQASLVLVLQGSTTIVGLISGVGAVAVFASLRTLANLVRQVANTLSNALWPELTALVAAERYAELRRVHRSAVKGLWALSLAAAASLALAGEDLFELWTGGRLACDRLVLGAFLVHLVLQAPWTASSYVLLASNQHQSLARRQLLAGVLGLGLGAWFALTLGPAGLVLGLSCAELLLCARFVPRAVVAMTGDDWRGFRDRVLLRGAILCGGVALVVRALTPGLASLDPGARILAAGVIGPATTLALALVLFLDEDERRQLRRILSWGARRASASPEAS